MKVYDKIKEIKLEYIEPDLDQPRQTFRWDTLHDLAKSIRDYGLINPILVEKFGNNDYKIVVGHRRYEAAKLAGIDKIRCQVVENLTPDQRLEIQLIEDSQEPIARWEIAAGVVKLYNKLEKKRRKRGDTKPYSVSLYATRLGKSELEVRRAFRYENLSAQIKKAVRNGEIKYNVATEIGRIDDKKTQLRLFPDYVASRGATLQNAREKVDEILNPEPLDNFLQAYEEKLTPLDKPIRDELYSYLNPTIRKLTTFVEISKIEKQVIRYSRKNGIAKHFKEFNSSFESLESVINKESNYLGTLERRPVKPTAQQRVFIGSKQRLKKAEGVASRHNYSNDVIQIPVDQIEEDPENIRRTFNYETLNEIADSIKNVGIIHPVLVEKQKNGKYRIVVGHRRTRGAILAGKRKIRALEISKLSEDDRIEIQIAEASQEPFSLNERAEFWWKLYKSKRKKAKKRNLEYEIDDFCSDVGKGRSTVRKAFSYHLLDSRIKNLVTTKVISYGVGVELSYIVNRELQYWIALESAIGNFTVKRTKNAIKESYQDEQYILPKTWKKNIEKYRKSVTLAYISKAISEIIKSNNEQITRCTDIKDPKIRKKVFGNRRVIRKIFELREISKRLSGNLKKTG